MNTSNADHTAGWETRTARATTSSKQAAYLSLPCKHESSITTLLLLSPQSRPALRGAPRRASGKRTVGSLGRLHHAAQSAWTHNVWPARKTGCHALGLKAVETPVTGCESCQALSALFPIAGARAANTAEKKTIATILATTKGKNPNFKFS